MISASQQIRRMVDAESCSPVSVVPNPAWVRRSSRSMVRVSRGVAPCAWGSTSVVWSCRQASARASSIRVPWSRGSRPSCPQPGMVQLWGSQTGPVVGWGAASGIRVALIWAASSVLQRPLIQAPPVWSSVMERCRERWAARSRRSRARSSRRSSPSGSRTVSRRRVSLRSSVASSALASVSRNCTPRVRRSGSPGRASRARSMTWAFAVESHPSPRASATGAMSGRSTAAARRTVAGPVPLWPPAMAVRKSWVEAQPTALTALVASSSRTTPSSRSSRVDFMASISATVSISSSRSRAAHNVSASPRTSPRIWARAAGTPRSRCSSGRLSIGEFKHLPLTVLGREFPAVEGNSPQLRWSATYGSAVVSTDRSSRLTARRGSLLDARLALAARPPTSGRTCPRKPIGGVCHAPGACWAPLIALSGPLPAGVVVSTDRSLALAARPPTALAARPPRGWGGWSRPIALSACPPATSRRPGARPEGPWRAGRRPGPRSSRRRTGC